MENRDPHIELPTAQLIRRNQPPPVPYNELPPDEEEGHQDPQIPQQNPPLLPQNPPPQRPQNSTLKARFQVWLTLLFGRDLEKAMRRAVRLMLFCFIINLILLCSITYDYYTGVRSRTQIRGALESISANLKADPIMYLQIINKKSTCPSGFEPLALNYWPGTMAGCLCDSGYLASWACSDLEGESCRKDIPLTNSMEIKEWDSSLWCGKRAVLGQDYVKKAECPLGYKECYNGGCFKEECPITKVELSSEKGLMLSRTQGELPLINIQTSSNDIPCFNKDFSAKSSSSYKLVSGEDLANKGCDKYGFDSQYSTKLSFQPLFDSYSQDSWKNSTRNLPYFEKYTKETTSVLSWRVRMNTAKNDSCLDLDYYRAKTSTWAFHGAFMPDIIIQEIVFLHVIILLLFGLCRCCLGKTEFLMSLGTIMQYSFLICLPATLLHWPGWFRYRTECYSELRIGHKYFAKFDELGCFGESQGGQVIQDLLWMLTKGETNFYVLYGLLSSTLVALLTCWWHFWIKRRFEASMRAYILNLPRI